MTDNREPAELLGDDLTLLGLARQHGLEPAVQVLQAHLQSSPTPAFPTPLDHGDTCAEGTEDEEAYKTGHSLLPADTAIKLYTD